MKEKILVIEDEEDILGLHAATLESEGYDVVTAVDGQKGMEEFKRSNPDLVITDVKMPVKDGIEVLKEIKESGSDVDVIILTGYSDEATAIECLRYGAYNYFVKPLEDIDVLLTAIDRVFYKQNLDRKNRQLLKQLEEMAIKDPLTGLYNYRHLLTCLDEEIARSERYSHFFCGVMLDVDHFKAVNDTLGHLFGDYILKKLAEIMCENLRSADRVFHYGGEEFFIIMPETSKEEGGTACNRLMDAVRYHDFTYEGKDAKITVSIGYAIHPEHARDKSGLITTANKALYRAKEVGGDRAVLFSTI